MRTSGARAGLYLAAGLSLALATVQAAPPADPPRARPKGSLEGWSSLTLGASKALIVSASATLTVQEGTHSARNQPAIVFRTRSSAHILGATGFQEETTSYLDRETHRPLEFFQMRPGESARRYLFLDGAVRQTTWHPPEGRPDSPFDQWLEVETVDRALRFSDGTVPRAGEPVTDFYSLIYLLRDLDVSSAREPKEFNTLYRRHVIRVRLVPGERRRNEREVIDETTGGTETLKLIERQVAVKPLGESAGSFRGLMGMQGDTEIWIDEASGALVEINGQAPGVGATQVLLTSFKRDRPG